MSNIQPTINRINASYLNMKDTYTIADIEYIYIYDNIKEYRW